jgi:hypothetical protein
MDIELRDGVGCDVGLLRLVGLLDGRKLLAKVNAFAGRVFVTDGLWIDPRRAWLHDEYALLALRHEGQGNPDIALGVIDVDLNPGVTT